MWLPCGVQAPHSEVKHALWVWAPHKARAPESRAIFTLWSEVPPWGPCTSSQVMGTLWVWSPHGGAMGNLGDLGTPQQHKWSPVSSGSPYRAWLPYSQVTGNLRVL